MVLKFSFRKFCFLMNDEFRLIFVFFDIDVRNVGNLWFLENDEFRGLDEIQLV